MSTPVPGTHNAAEEEKSEALFDELDALLQRMLALPVEPSDRTPTPKPPLNDEILDELPLITIAEAAPLAYLESPPVSPPPPRMEKPKPKPASPVRPQAPVPSPRVELPKPTPLPPPTPVPKPEPEPVAASVASTPVEPPRVEEPVHVDTTPASGPVAWMNDCFDRLTIPLGYTGRWLRLGFGRTLIGWLGVVMLLAAGGLLLWGCIDWTW